MNTTTSHPTVRATLTRPPAVSGMILFWLVLLLFMGAGVVQDALILARTQGDATASYAAVAVFGAMFLGWAAVVARRFHVRRLGPCTIELFDDHALLPLGLEAARPRRVRYDDIVAVAVRGPSLNRFLYVESRQRVFLYSGHTFTDPQGPERIAAALRSRIADTVGGPERLLSMEQRLALGQYLLATTPIATQSLIGVSLVLFANIIYLEDISGPMGWIAWGATVPALVGQGEPWRLFSAAFLHGGFYHAGFSLLGLYVVGGLLERLIGWSRLLITFFVSALCAAWVAVLFDSPVWLGTSAAVLGLFGTYAVVSVRTGGTLPLGFRQPRRWWGLMAALGGVLVTTAPAVGFAGHLDIEAHGAGLLSGALLGLLWSNRPEKSDGWRERAMGLTLLGIAAAAVHAIALAVAVDYAAGFGTEESLRVAKAVDEGGQGEPALLNAIAWGWALDEGSSKPQLTWAASVSERVVAAEPEQAAFRDTLATVYAGLHRWDDAVQQEIMALEQTHDVFMAWQVARFAASRRRALERAEPTHGGQSDPAQQEHADREEERGEDLFIEETDVAAPREPAEAALSSEAHSLQVAWLPVPEGGQGRARMKISLSSATVEPTRAYVVVEHHGKNIALVQLTFAAGASGSYEVAPDRTQMLGQWPDDILLWVADVRPVQDGAKETIDWFIWPLQGQGL